MCRAFPLTGIVAFCLWMLPGALVGQVPDGKEAAPLDLLVIAPHPDDEAIGCTAVMMHAILKEYETKLSPVEDGLAETFTREEEVFEGVRIK